MVCQFLQLESRKPEDFLRYIFYISETNFTIQVLFKATQVHITTPSIEPANRPKQVTTRVWNRLDQHYNL